MSRIDLPHVPSSESRPVARNAIVDASPLLELRLLGSFELRDTSGQPVRLSTRKAEALLALLALRPGQPQARDKLCALLWPDVRAAQAQHSLRQTLLQLRKGLGPALLASDVRGLQLSAAKVEVDVAQLEQCVSDGTPDALADVWLWDRGELLEGFRVGEAPFDEWLIAERKRLRALLAQALTRLLTLEGDAGRDAAAQRACARLLELDPLREEAHRGMMRLLAKQGRRAAALQHYRSFADALRAQLGTAPDPLTEQLRAELAGTALVPAAAVQQPSAAETSGRTRELQQLFATLSAAQPGQTRVALIAGEAGVGKTHLCDRVADEAAALGFRTLRARSFESEQVLPLSLWANLLRDAITPELSLSREQRAELATLVPELAREESARSSDFRQLFLAVLELVTRLAEPAPLLLLLEDVHWADEMSARLLSYLGRHQRQARCVILVSAREEDMPPSSFVRAALAELQREQLLLRVELAPLSRPDTEQLAGRLAEQRALPLETALHEQIWAISEGNPLVIVESVRALAAGELARDVTRLPTPERMRTLIVSRVAKVSAPARDVLAVAAVAGRELELEVLLTALDGTGLQLTAALDELAQAQLVRAVDDRVYFTHDRIRETLYGDMLPVSRRLLHGKVARALEQRADPAPATLGHIGYHFSNAGDAPAAVRYLVRFADRAYRDHGVHEALVALERAFDDCTRLPKPECERTQIEIMIREATCLTSLGRFADLVARMTALESQLDALQAPELAGPFHFYWGFALALMAERREAESHAQLALQYASRAEDRRVTGYTHALLSYLCQMTGRCRQGVSHGGLATELLAAVGDTSDATVIAWLSLGMNQLWLGEAHAALRSAGRAAAIASAAHSQRGRALAATATGCAFAYTEQWELALEATQRGVEYAKDPFTQVSAAWMAAWARAGSGHTEQAIELLTQVTDQLSTHGLRAWSAHAKSIHADALLRAGDAEGAARLAREALEIAEETGDRSCAGWAMRAQGQAACARGQLTAARGMLDRALRLFEELEARVDCAKVLYERAVVGIADGDRGAALGDLERARELFSGCAVRTPLERIGRLELLLRASSSGG